MPCAGADALSSQRGESVDPSPCATPLPHTSLRVQMPSTCRKRSASPAKPVAAKLGNMATGAPHRSGTAGSVELVPVAPAGHAVAKPMADTLA